MKPNRGELETGVRGEEEGIGKGKGGERRGEGGEEGEICSYISLNHVNDFSVMSSRSKIWNEI